MNSEPAKLPVRELIPRFVAQVTVFMALVVPIGFSLAVRIGAIDPANKDAVLAMAIGIAGSAFPATPTALEPGADTAMGRVPSRV